MSGLTIATARLSTSTLNGGGIVNDGTLTVDRSTFTDDSAPSGYGGGIENDGTLTVKTPPSRTTRPEWGGAINNTGSLTLTGTSLNSNAAAVGGVGGAIASGKISPLPEPPRSPSTTARSAAIQPRTAAVSGTMARWQSATASSATTRPLSPRRGRRHFVQWRNGEHHQ